MVHFQSSIGPGGDTTGVSLELLPVELLDEIEPLWASLVDHHTALNGAVPFRSADDSWPRLRELYVEILADDGFCLVARRDGRSVGYAMVKFEGPECVWRTGDVLAELETLAVLDDERGAGVGGLLMDEVERELAVRGCDDLIIGVEAPNAAGQRFYERRGYEHAFTWLYGKPVTLARGERARASRAPATAPQVSVIGASSCSAELAALADRLGEELARRGCTVFCGGYSGVMEAVSRGVRRGGGVCVGILPALDRRQAAPDLTLSVCTGIGHARNLAVVASGDVVIAVGGAWGTLSEIGMARAIGRQVVLLRSWAVSTEEGEVDGLHRASGASEAVDLALSLLPA